MSVERLLPWLVFLGACGWTTGGVDNTGGGDPKSVPCEEASEGDSCVSEAERCSGGGDECSSVERVCQAGTWKVEVTGLSCPTTLPAPGSACEQQISVCKGACAYGDVVALCDGSWNLVTLSDCTLHETETDCAHDGYCRWTRDCATEANRCVPSMLCGYGCAPGLSCQEIELPLVDGSCEDPVPTMLCLP